MKYGACITMVLVAFVMNGCVVTRDTARGKVGAMCGGTSGMQCGSGLYCDFGDGTTAAPSSCGGGGNQSGKCAAKPEMCTQEYSPMCGCDGTTYSNACMAHGIGVTVSKPGECLP
jgi:hypothetical protein